MKKLDKLLIKGFIPPFLVTFMIATFVLLMQFLWLYIDDIAGKGLGILIIFELLAYKCVGLIPLAMPLAILISSVMVFGNMGERYELSSFKSGGVSLARIMAPIIIFGVFAAWFSFFSANNLIPVANLKFGSRMWDITHQKPALNLEANVFNDDFKGFAIHLGKKNPDGHRIEDVLIYDHRDASSGLLREIIAKEGEMYSSEDEKYFVLNLKNGNQYVEQKSAKRGKGKNKGQTYPFIRTKFKSWTKLFDLGEFDLSRTDVTTMQKHRKVLNVAQLGVASDSIATELDRKLVKVSNHLANYLYFMEEDSIFIHQMAAKTKALKEVNAKKEKEAIKMDALLQGEPEAKKQQIQSTIIKTKKSKPIKPKKLKKKKRLGPFPLVQKLDSLNTYTSILQSFPEKDNTRLLSKAKNTAQSIQRQAKAATESSTKEMQVKVVFDLHSKYSFAVVCLIFVFIGAPMGAIVRKGGFGYPVLIAIMFFISFIILSMACKKVSETFVISAELAAWLPCIIFFPIGLFLTVRAMNDSKIVNTDGISNIFRKLFKKRTET